MCPALSPSVELFDIMQIVGLCVRAVVLLWSFFSKRSNLVKREDDGLIVKASR